MLINDERKERLLNRLVESVKEADSEASLEYLSDLLESIIQQEPELTLKALVKISPLLAEASLENIEPVGGGLEYSLNINGEASELKEEGLTTSAELLTLLNNIRVLSNRIYNLELRDIKGYEFER